MQLMLHTVQVWVLSVGFPVAVFLSLLIIYQILFFSPPALKLKLILVNQFFKSRESICKISESITTRS